MPKRVKIKEKNLKLLAAIQGAGHHSLRDFSLRAGIGYNNMLRYVNCQARPQKKIARKIARELGVPVDSLNFFT